MRRNSNKVLKDVLLNLRKKLHKRRSRHMLAQEVGKNLGSHKGISGFGLGLGLTQRRCTSGHA